MTFLSLGCLIVLNLAAIKLTARMASTSHCRRSVSIWQCLEFFAHAKLHGHFNGFGEHVFLPRLRPQNTSDAFAHKEIAAPPLSFTARQGQVTQVSNRTRLPPLSSKVRARLALGAPQTSDGHAKRQHQCVWFLKWRRNAAVHQTSPKRYITIIVSKRSVANKGGLIALARTIKKCIP